MSTWINVFRSDARRILRDPFLFFLIIAPLLFGLLARWGIPLLTEKLSAQLDLVHYYPLIIVLLIITGPAYFGTVMAFQILDEKDENSLLPIAVTPFSLKNYFTLRIFIYTLASVPLVALVHIEMNLLSISSLKLWSVAAVAALNAPFIALVVASFARNQVEGFAVLKGSGFLILFPMAMFFVPSYWHLLCGVLPSYWPIIAYFTAVQEGGSELFFWIAVFMALLTQTLAIRILYHKFEKNVICS